MNATRMIELRKKADAAFDKMESSLAAEKRAIEIANFEVKTTNKIEKRTKQDRFERMKLDNELSLLERRRELADLYNNEMDMWKEELLSNVETQEVRKARIMERAYALRDAREEERKERVEKCYDSLWRDSCDDARTLDSVAMGAYMHKQRLEQIEEKIKRKERLKLDENSFLVEWKKQLESMNSRDQQKMENRRTAQNNNTNGLLDQMNYNKNRKNDEANAQRKEDNEEIDRIRAALAADKELSRQRSENARENGKEVLRANAETRVLIEQESKMQRDQDAMLLQYAMDKERDAAIAEEAKKNLARNAAGEFRKYLEDQMLKEAQNDAHADSIRKAEEEKVWKARDDALEARRVARSNLMHLVDEGRQEQIEYRRQQGVAEKKEGERFAQTFMEEAKEGIAREKEAMQARRALAVENNSHLQMQINGRVERQQKEAQDNYLADKHMQYMEKLHQEKLATQGGAVRTFRPLQKNNWYS